MKTEGMVRIAVFTALLCALSPLAIPVGPVPVTLCTLIIYICSGVLGSRRAALAVAVYIALGTFGLPVFTGFSGGAAKLLGVTGGYILGYIPLALLSGAFCRGGRLRAAPYAVGMALGTVVLYLLGTAWFVLQTDSAVPAALSMCVLPFLPGDAAKIAAAVVCAPAIRRSTERLRA